MSATDLGTGSGTAHERVRAALAELVMLYRLNRMAAPIDNANGHDTSEREKAAWADAQAALVAAMKTGPGPAPNGLLFLPAGGAWEELDAELHRLSQRYQGQARRARAAAKAHRSRGDLVRWRKSNTVARVYEMVDHDLWFLSQPF